MYMLFSFLYQLENDERLPCLMKIDLLCNNSLYLCYVKKVKNNNSWEICSTQIFSQEIYKVVYCL